MTLTLADQLGASLYIVTMLTALVAARIDRERSQRPVFAQFHWLAIAALFAGLAAWRLGDGEGQVQAILRRELLDSGRYASRHVLQKPLFMAMVAVAVAAAISGWAAWRWWTQPLHRAISGAGALGLLLFSLVRLVSYHFFDRLIYASFGPLRLNYLIELALIGAVFYGVWLLYLLHKSSCERRRAANREGRERDLK